MQNASNFGIYIHRRIRIFTTSLNDLIVNQISNNNIALRS